MLDMRQGGNLTGVSRCPHCGVATPLLTEKFKHISKFDNNGVSRYVRWGVYYCTNCKSLVLARSDPTDYDAGSEYVKAIYPSNHIAISKAIPERARVYLKQALESFGQPDGCAMLAASAIDAMLKHKSYVDGSLYARIEKANTDGVLTTDMKDWAHEIRILSNNPRHADLDDPHVSSEQAANILDFTRTLGQILFDLPSRIAKGREETGKAE